MSAKVFISNGLRHLRNVCCPPRSTSLDSSDDQSESGAALVEFTILVPVFFVILFGMIEFGSVFFVQNAMVSAARETARTVAVQGITAAASIKPNVCPWLATSNRTFNVNYVDKCTGVGTGPQDVTATVTTDAAVASIINYLGLFSGTTISAQVTMRKETPCAAPGTTVPFTCP